MEDYTTDLMVAVTGSLSVNRYRWINIWTAILGHIFTSLPVFFEIARILLQWLTENFLTPLAMRAFIFCILGGLSV